MLRIPLLCAAAAALIAADGAIAADGEPWRGAVTPYLLLANITGDAADGEPATLPVEVDTGTVLEHLDLGVMVRGKIGRGAWTLLGDLAYIKLTDDKARANGTDVTAELTQLIA